MHLRVSKLSRISTRTPPVEAALVVTYLQFPIQVCFLCIGQPVTDTASVTDTFLNSSWVFIVVAMDGQGHNIHHTSIPSCGQKILRCIQ